MTSTTNTALPARRPRYRRRTIVIVALVATALILFVASRTLGGPNAPAPAMVVTDAVVDRPVNGSSSAVRMAINNQTGRADALLSVSSQVAGRTSLHRSTIDGRGRAEMVPLDRVDLPDRQMTLFASGGLHVMLEDLRTDLEEGDTVTLRLRFRHAGTITVTAPVVAPGMTMDHGDMADHTAHR